MNRLKWEKWNGNPQLTQASPLSFSLPSLQILMSALKGSTTAGRTPCALTPLAPSCASAVRATSGSMTIPAQVSSCADLLTGWNQVEKVLILFCAVSFSLRSNHFVLRLDVSLSRTNKEGFLFLYAWWDQIRGRFKEVQKHCVFIGGFYRWSFEGDTVCLPTVGYCLLEMT